MSTRYKAMKDGLCMFKDCISTTVAIIEANKIVHNYNISELPVQIDIVDQNTELTIHTITYDLDYQVHL